MNRRKIGRFMKQLGLKVKTKKKFKPLVSAPINSPLIAPNRLKRRFNVKLHESNMGWRRHSNQNPAGLGLLSGLH